MNSTLWKRMAPIAMVAVALVIAIPAFAAQPDPWISARVKISLITSDKVSAKPIDVDTYDGRVTLNGKVRTSAERAEAGRLAAKVSGVRSVRNLLQIVPASREKAVAIADDKLRDQVSAELAASPELKSSSIRVKSVSNGVVMLDGTASTMSDHLEALELASSVPGVHRVDTEIQSPDKLSDMDLWTDAQPAEPSNGNAVTDAWITGKTKLHFMTDADIPASDINVDTHRGNVMLFGTVPSKAISDKAAQVAHDVTGVHSVKNELRVVAPKNKKRLMAADDQINTTIDKRLHEADLAGSNIHVEVKAGVARLSGSVQHPTDRYMAVVIARSTDGVAGVHDDIKVEPQTATDK